MQELEDVAAGVRFYGFGSQPFVGVSSNWEGQMTDQAVRVRTWARASEADTKTGLLGFLSIECGRWVFDGICLRRTSGGRFALSFPARTDRTGRRHSYIRPVDDEARIAIEREILGQLGQRPDLVEQREASDG